VRLKDCSPLLACSDHQTFGVPGTGKSHLLREIIVALRIKYGQGAAVAVTAATGIAALQVGGSTVHSFAGIGLGRKKVPALLSKIGRWSNAAKRWREVKVWIVDESESLRPWVDRGIPDVSRLTFRQSA
jgi:ATP-dependent DNA helicase PIF1